MKNFDYLEPKTVAEACALLKQHGGEAKVFAGGAHLTILMKQGLLEPKSLVNIKKIAELKGIRYDDADRLDHRRVGDTPRVRNFGAGEREISGAVRSREGSRQHPRAQHGHRRRQSRFRRAADRSVANISSRWTAKRRSPARRAADDRRSKNCFSTFIRPVLAEDEILTQVVLPPLPPRSGIDYIRFSSSSVVDKPSAGVAVRLTLDSGAETIQTARIVLGCVGATPVRARKAEALLIGKKMTRRVGARSRQHRVARVQSDQRPARLGAVQARDRQDAGEARGGESVRAGRGWSNRVQVKMKKAKRLTVFLLA